MMEGNRRNENEVCFLSNILYYFGGARRKGFATLRNVSKLQFFDKIWASKVCRFSVLFGYLTK